jgi:hypothetical protein
VNRWVLAYAPLIERRLRPFRKLHCGSVRVDETYVRIRGEWRYLYWAIDKHGEAVDFLLTAMLWLRKGFGFAGAWTVVEQNRLLGFCFGLSNPARSRRSAMAAMGAARPSSARARHAAPR